MSFFCNLPTILFSTVFRHSSPLMPFVYLSPYVLLLQSPYICLPLPLCPSTTISLYLLTSPPMSFYYNLPIFVYLSPYVLLLQSPYICLPLPICPSTTSSLYLFTSPPMSFYYNLPIFVYLSPYVLLLQSPYICLPLPLCPSTTISLYLFTSPPKSFYYNLPLFVILLQSPYICLPLPLSHSTTISLYLFTSPPMSFYYNLLHFFTPQSLSILSTLVYLSDAYQPQAISQLVRRLFILPCHITHPPYHYVTLHIHRTTIMSHYTSSIPSSHHVISLQLCQIFFFHWSDLTTTRTTFLTRG